MNILEGVEEQLPGYYKLRLKHNSLSQLWHSHSNHSHRIRLPGHQIPHILQMATAPTTNRPGLGIELPHCQTWSGHFRALTAKTHARETCHVVTPGETMPTMFNYGGH